MPGISGLRGRHLFIIDLGIITLSIIGAMLLRFDTLRFADEALIYFPAALFPLIVRPPINVLGGLYSRAWAYASVAELVRIALVVLVGSVVGIVFFYGLLVPLGVHGTETAVGRFPRSFFVLEGLLTLAGMGGARFLIRASTDWQGWGLRGGVGRGRASSTDGSGPMPTLVYGAGAVGATVLRTIASARDGLGMKVVGVLDDDQSKRNQVIRGTKVLGGLNELAEIASQNKIFRSFIGMGY
jgi:dTDP-glucose 4,6-dehydratase